MSELRAVRGLLQQAMLHLLKIPAAPETSHVKRWKDDTQAILFDAEASCPRRCASGWLSSRGDGRTLVLPRGNPQTAPALVTRLPDIGALLARLTPPPSPS